MLLNSKNCVENLYENFTYGLPHIMNQTCMCSLGSAVVMRSEPHALNHFVCKSLGWVDLNLSLSEIVLEGNYLVYSHLSSCELSVCNFLWYTYLLHKNVKCQGESLKPLNPFSLGWLKSL